MIDPGHLNRRLALEAPLETPDGAGGVVRSYDTVATLWAQVTPVSARGEVEAERLGGAVTHLIRIRRSPDVTTRHRFRDGATLYRIVSIRDRDGRGRFLDIAAEERVD
ncbi:MAG: phage head closure protein [Pseudorhodoplanes sp.]|nr:phage head closure protein [Pseudorhodoplanes sp.]